MRLAIVTPFLESFGGVEKVVSVLAERFDATMYTTRFNPATTYPELKEFDIRLVRSPIGSLPGGRLVSAIDAAHAFYNLKLDDFDVVNAHQSPSEFARRHNSPMLLYCHTPNREAFDLYEWRMQRRSPIQKPFFWAAIRAFRHLESRVMPKIEYIFTNSRNSQARIRRYLHRDAEVLYPGIEPKEFRCEGYEKFFFYPSRIVPEKEMGYAIGAFHRFIRLHPGWKLVIAGSLSGRPEHQAYFRHLQRLAGNAPVRFIPNVPERQLKDLYARCRGVLFTPINEDLGLIPLEAAAASKPCIARNEGGPRETIQNGKDGFLVDTPAQMAECMVALAENVSLAERMGKAGRAKVLRRFTWSSFLRRFGQKARELARTRRD